MNTKMLGYATVGLTLVGGLYLWWKRSQCDSMLRASLLINGRPAAGEEHLALGTPYSVAVKVHNGHNEPLSLAYIVWGLQQIARGVVVGACSSAKFTKTITFETGGEWSTSIGLRETETSDYILFPGPYLIVA